MKLHDLFEEYQASDIRSASKANLVVEIRKHAGADLELYIIKDVPAISYSQYEQLSRASFERHSRSHDMVISPVMVRPGVSDKAINHWYDSIESGRNPPKKIEAVTWKQFIAYVKDEHPSKIDWDDFSDMDMN